MKTIKITYWITTALTSVMMLYATYMYFTAPMLKVAMAHLGFPDFFRIELGVAKFIGAILLILPGVPVLLRHFAYFGFFIMFLSAVAAHIAAGDPASVWSAPIISTIILLVSYLCFLRLKGQTRLIGKTPVVSAA